jgi:hypothetical protein
MDAISIYIDVQICMFSYILQLICLSTYFFEYKCNIYKKYIYIYILMSVVFLRDCVRKGPARPGGSQLEYPLQHRIGYRSTDAETAM